MAMTCEPEIERFQYWEGQRLRSRDFRDQIAVEAQLRWWHNRALHGAFGVRYGFQVADVVEGGILVALKIGCGLAYDCFGRELILQTDKNIDVPDPIGTSPKPVLLVVSYKDSSSFRPKRELLNACPGGSVTLEEPRFTWMRSVEFRPHHGVPIARIRYEGASHQPERDLLFRVPPSRALKRPRVASGATIPGDTPWELWTEAVRASQRLHVLNLGMQVDIDTSAFGFNETPLYFAWLSGQIRKAANIAFFPAPMLHIASASYKQFRVRLWMPTLNLMLGGRARKGNQGFENEFINYAREQGLHICWIAVQCRPDVGCEPLAECECSVTPETIETPSYGVHK
ncbi:MAG TPA: hypothetical protein VFF31_01425 [Blastocatellia bacterium]|nr:hypothetical protein [Blastocatellia bacterium]